jgi:translocation protein SEC63
MVEQAGSSPLFAVFFLSVFSLFLIPYTIYKLCVAASPEEVVRPWEAVSALTEPASTRTAEQHCIP